MVTNVIFLIYMCIYTCKMNKFYLCIHNIITADSPLNIMVYIIVVILLGFSNLDTNIMRQLRQNGHKCRILLKIYYK